MLLKLLGKNRADEHQWSFNPMDEVLSSAFSQSIGVKNQNEVEV